ncbi:MAG TPA: Ig-like domain-containing protein, partial [Desulfitobacteriaceae bacterium]|nr:Ig-like domain-containing protein [Desulfitobacteriaceae bacterium]
MSLIERTRNNKILGMVLAVVLLVTGLFDTALLQPGQAFAAEVSPEVTVGTVTGNPGDTIDIPLTLTSSGEVYGAQFDLAYDQSLLAPILDANGKPVFTGSSFTNGFNINTSKLAGGNVRVGITYQSKISFPAGTGELITLKFQAAAGAAPGGSCDLTLYKSGTTPGVKLMSSSNTYLSNAVATNGQFSVFNPVIAVSGISLDKTTDSITAGGTTQLTAAVVPDNATNKEVTWSSNNEAAATVDQTGLVTAVAEGTAVITAITADGGLTATCVVTVQPAQAETIAVTGVSLDKTTDSITAGGTTQLTATVVPDNATNKEVTWSSDNEAAATVDQTG